MERLEGEPGGNSGKDERTLPGYKTAVIPAEKLVRYALNKGHARGGRDKAVAFERALGYNISNHQDLRDNILAHLAKFPAGLRARNQYGDKYEVVMKLRGPNGKTAMVVTAWLVEKKGSTRLVSVYVKD